jgi:hypothetical protein
MKKQMNNNIIRFPSILGSRFRVSTSKYVDNGQEITDMDNYIFYGNKIVLKFRGPALNAYDMWLYFQIIENFQKKSVSIVSKVNYEEDEFISLKEKKLLYEEYKEKYKKELFHMYGEEKKVFLKTKIDEEIEKRLKLIEKDLYLNTKNSVMTKMCLDEVLKDRGLVNNIRSRESVFYSLEKLQSTGLTWFVLNEELSEDFKKIKAKHSNNYSLYKEELKSHFEKNKRKSNTYMRSLLEEVSLDEDFKTSTVKIDEGFYNLTLNSQFFNFSALKNIKGNMAKTLYVNISFAFKPKMTKEYLYEILCLSVDNREDNKLAQSKKAVEELIKVGVLEKTSGYDRESKSFNFSITDEYKLIMGLKSQIEYSKNKPSTKKVGSKK